MAPGFGLGTETDTLVISQFVRQRGNFDVFGLNGHVFTQNDFGILSGLIEERLQHRRDLAFSSGL